MILRLPSIWFILIQFFISSYLLFILFINYSSIQILGSLCSCVLYFLDWFAPYGAIHSGTGIGSLEGYDIFLFCTPHGNVTYPFENFCFYSGLHTLSRSTNISSFLSFDDFFKFLSPSYNLPSILISLDFFCMMFQVCEFCCSSVRWSPVRASYLVRR